jgi:hypothetical protein
MWKGYNDKMSPDEQITAEERIAHEVFTSEGTEEDCAQKGRDILKMILKEFRPDLFS